MAVLKWWAHPDLNRKPKNYEVFVGSIKTRVKCYRDLIRT